MKIIEGQITVPMMGHFILLITTSFLIGITCFQEFPKAKMLNYGMYYFQNIRGSNNCPNGGTFYFAYYYIISDQNHVLSGISES